MVISYGSTSFTDHGIVLGSKLITVLINPFPVGGFYPDESGYALYPAASAAKSNWDDGDTTAPAAAAAATAASNTALASTVRGLSC